MIFALIVVFLALIVYGLYRAGPENEDGVEISDTSVYDNESSRGNISTDDSVNKSMDIEGNLSEGNATIVVNASAKQLTAHQKCLSKFPVLKEDAIIFRYADWSSFSAEWEPTFKKIEELNYTAVKARVGNETSGSFYENEDYMKECFEGVYKERTIPQFICAGSKEQFIGLEADVYTLKDFAESCRQAAGRTEPERTVPQTI